MIDWFKSLSESFQTLSVSDQLELLTDLLRRHVLIHHLHLPDNFLELAKGLGPNLKEALFPVVFSSTLACMRTKGYSSRLVCLLFCQLVCFGAQSAFIDVQLVHG